MNSAPGTAELMLTFAAVLPEHIVCDVRLRTVLGCGFTFTVTCTGVEAHPDAVPVTVKVAKEGVVFPFEKI